METTIAVTQYTCEQCLHKWIPRRKRKPRVCPVCKRVTWHTPKSPTATAESAPWARRG